jgi:hypothetical protein
MAPFAPSRRATGIAVGLSLVVVATALLAYATEAWNTADIAQTLHLPGFPPPDSAPYDSLGLSAFMGAVVAAGAAMLALFRHGWWFFAGTALLSVFALAEGVWLAIAAEPVLMPLRIGPLRLSEPLTGEVLAIAAAASLAASLVGLGTSPLEPRLGQPPMPPQTHQG